MSTTKAKINLKEGTIELEGSEAFVSKHLEAFEKQIKTVTPAQPPDEDTKKDFDEEPSEKPSRKKTPRTPQIVAPLPLDLKAKNGKPGLREFFKEKNPKNQQENLTVYAYYLKKHLKINDMQVGHVVSCAKEVKRPVPSNTPSVFKNIQHRKGWLHAGSGGESAQITIPGENYVEYDLPRKKDAPKNKATT
jgi:hypothetical protein